MKRSTATCPHCSSPVDPSAAARATKRRPLICPNCRNSSWFCAPSGSYIVQAPIVVVVVVAVREFGLTGWPGLAAVVVAAVALSIPVRVWIRRKGWLTPIPSPPAELGPGKTVVGPLFQHAFGALVAVQAMHSIEECWGRLWESFPPARLVAGLISADLERGFIIGNVVLVAFGAWCYFWPVRNNWGVATAVAWFWVVIETINGLGHPLWSLRQGGYTPGVATAPVLLFLAIYLAFQLRRRLDESQAAV